MEPQQFDAPTPTPAKTPQRADDELRSLRVAQLAAARLDKEHANNSRRVRSRMLAPAKPVPAAKCDKTSLSKIGEQACAWGTPPRPPCLRRPGRGLASRRGLFPPPLHEAAGLVAARRRKPSLSRHHASPEAPTVGRRSVVVRDDGTNDASQKLGARGATAREIALTSEFTSKTLTFDRSKLRPRRATRAEKRCVRMPRAERTNFPEPGGYSSLGRRQGGWGAARAQRPWASRPRGTKIRTPRVVLRVRKYPDTRGDRS